MNVLQNTLYQNKSSLQAEYQMLVQTFAYKCYFFFLFSYQKVLLFFLDYANFLLQLVFCVD